jgi:hypothetical protein
MSTVAALKPVPSTVPAPLSPARAELRQSLERLSELATRAGEQDEVLGRLRILEAAVTSAKAGLEALETEHKANVDAWSNGGCMGRPPVRDEQKFLTAKVALAAAEGDAEAARRAADAVRARLRPILAERDAENTRAARCLRTIALEEAEALFTQIETLGEERNRHRAAIAGLADALQAASMRNGAVVDNEASGIAHRLRARLGDRNLTHDEVATLERAQRTAQDRWLAFASLLRCDPEVRFSMEQT